MIHPKGSMQVMRIIAAVGLAVAAGCSTGSRDQVVSSGAGGSQEAVASAGSTAVDVCSEASYVGSDGSPVDWDETVGRFDAKGPFRLPDMPEWAPVEAYCTSILVAVAPSPPAPDGAEVVEPGVNRFVLGAEAKSIDEVRYANAVLVALYPGSIHEVFDSSGAMAGYLAPGLGMTTLSEFATADDVAASPEVRDAAAEIINSCTKESCDTMTEAAIDSGNEGVIGALVTP